MDTQPRITGQRATIKHAHDDAKPKLRGASRPGKRPTRPKHQWRVGRPQCRRCFGFVPEPLVSSPKKRCKTLPTTGPIG
eukprot:15468661-Alexandrium_andersonii.AAC.1